MSTNTRLSGIDRARSCITACCLGCGTSFGANLNYSAGRCDAAWRMCDQSTPLLATFTKVRTCHSFFQQRLQLLVPPGVSTAALREVLETAGPIEALNRDATGVGVILGAVMAASSATRFMHVIACAGQHPAPQAAFPSVCPPSMHALRIRTNVRAVPEQTGAALFKLPHTMDYDTAVARNVSCFVICCLACFT